jgi:uncharacterized membrane protein YphA (DoxX/SURF4 family)
VRPYVVWPWTCGLTVLLAGIALAWRRVSEARGLDKLIVLGPVFFAAPLAAFAAEHMTITQGIASIIPDWYPAKLAIAYFVGGCLFAAAASLISGILDWLAAALLGLMFVIFVTTMHVPGAIQTGDHYAWIVALRDLSFGGGAMAYAGALGVGRLSNGSSWLGTLGRLIVAIACVVFGVLHCLQPTHTPGVPLKKLMPAWLPAPALWGYVTGVLEFVAGGFLLLDRQTREVTGALGLVVVAIVIVVYLPFVGTAVEGGDKLEALNYVWDTLLFTGTVLLVGTARRP